MANLIPFNFESKEIRVVQDDDGEPLFVAKDVLTALDYGTDNVSVRIKHVPDEWKYRKPIATTGGTQQMATLNKQGLLFFLSRSDRPKATKLMKSWFSSSLDVSGILKALDDFETPDDLPDMYVYAIREVDTGHIKLGISRDPHRRLATLQTGNSSELELVAYRKAENRFEDERALHADASEYRLRGEWFSVGALGVMQ